MIIIRRPLITNFLRVYSVKIYLKILKDFQKIIKMYLYDLLYNIGTIFYYNLIKNLYTRSLNYFY